MADYSDAYENSIERKRADIRIGLRDQGFLVKFRSLDSANIESLSCLYCGVLAWSDVLHRQFCKGPIAGG